MSKQKDAAAVAEFDDWAPNPNGASDLRCPSCSGPSLDGNRCQACQEESSIKRTDAATSARHEVIVSASAQPVDTTSSSASITSTPSAKDLSTNIVSVNADRSQPIPESTTAMKQRAMAARAKAVADEALKPHEGLPKRPKADAIQAREAQRSAVVTRHPNIPLNIPPKPERPRHATAIAIAALTVAAMVVGAPWLRTYKESVFGRPSSPAPMVVTDEPTVTADAGDRALPAEAPAAATTAAQDRKSALPEERPVAPATSTADRKSPTTASPKASTPTLAKPTTPARPPRRAAAPAVVNKPGRIQDWARLGPTDPVLTPAPVSAPPVANIVAPEPAPAAPPPAVGPFFEIRDVNESPRIATRAEPKLTGALKSRSIKEMVVVRALVSQSGHPSRISLLRRTKTGPELDDVVLEAVNKWTFSPAKKKGEAVSCWFNFAVQVGGVD